ncbi:SDR family oxidoreductase (plasmid) [Agrobacterium tumefaciens]|uniref:SDR family oxidoreductase n=1 Tax=Agrobacterium tumefaciens TaxID=358 RepID=A0AAP9J9G8_AGRTU|nr:SDR family NAD(P)-dependent oxidoreductase [Agrobacterium tumefaciens]NSZ61461.1 SDR family oxidoreductase [Agrobacterium tumefaciens]NTZ64230.1 SDR family oxidoreductase [Agrobacterium tumefaciens]QDY97618.1 SDR family oxidoreductase [Agrobacterium tumefaciens]QDY97750.1 SDR family oxidoreductase [Agrobacterium tumefaciens]UXS12743.1 SDR family oxidoreductase [Agrobacterium tumefaciens]
MSKEKQGRLQGKRVLITGTGGGQGETALRLFAAEGATVVGCDLKEGTAEAVAKQLRDEGYDVWAETVDLTNAEQATAWVQKGAERMGGVDVLYNNASGFGFAPFTDMTFDLWNHVINVELHLVFHTTKAAWPHLLDGGGSLINIGSYSALRGIEPLAQVAHATAKGGVISMTRALAAEGASHGVRANSISPGFISTPATDKAVDPEGKAWQVGNALIRRPGRAEDIAYTALYLASDEASWVTGQNFVVDGGATAGWRDDAETARLAAKTKKA